MFNKILSILDRIKKKFDTLPLSNELKEIINFPNSITMLRVTIIPILFFLLYNSSQIISLLIAIFFVLASLTDIFDGYIARRYNLSTKIGKLLDPMVDKMIINTAMIIMIQLNRIPAWIVTLIILRDILINGIRNFASLKGQIIAAGVLGKYKTFIQEVSITALLMHYPIFNLNIHLIGMIILYIALILTILSGIEYYLKFFYMNYTIKN